MEVRKVKKDRVFLLFISIILTISVVFVGTFAVFSSSATATGTITFDVNVTVEVESTGGIANGATGSSPSISYELVASFDQSNQNLGNFYGNLSGTYGKLAFSNTDTTIPGIQYNIRGKGEAYVGFQMQIKFTPDGSEGNTYADFGAGSAKDLTKVDNWNIYPSFNGFTASEVQYGIDGVNGTDFSFYKGTLNVQSYGLVCSAPVVKAEGTYYTKTYTMFVVANDGSYADTTKLTLSNTAIEFALSDIINGVNFALDIDGEEVDLLTGGQIALGVTCKAGIFTFTDF